jgi:hypothetical protein
MAFAGIHDRAHGRKEVASPCGAKPVGELPKDGAQADGLLAGVIRGERAASSRHSNTWSWIVG